jgi:hypothetical protein
MQASASSKVVVARNIGVIAHRTSSFLYPRTVAPSAVVFDNYTSRPIINNKGRFFPTSSFSSSATLPPPTMSDISDPCCESCKNVANKVHYHKIPKADHGEYEEFSVIFTNRSLNLMSKPFQQVMRDLNELLKTTYNADKVAIIPG